VPVRNEKEEEKKNSLEHESFIIFTLEILNVYAYKGFCGWRS